MTLAGRILENCPVVRARVQDEVLSFTLATGEAVDLPAYAGVVGVGQQRVRTWFVPGDYLIGMDFLRAVCSRVVLDFQTDSVSLQ